MEKIYEKETLLWELLTWSFSLLASRGSTTSSPLPETDILMLRGTRFFAPSNCSFQKALVFNPQLSTKTGGSFNIRSFLVCQSGKPGNTQGPPPLSAFHSVLTTGMLAFVTSARKWPATNASLHNIHEWHACLEQWKHTWTQDYEAPSHKQTSFIV